MHVLVVFKAKITYPNPFMFGCFILFIVVVLVLVQIHLVCVFLAYIFSVNLLLSKLHTQLM